MSAASADPIRVKLLATASALLVLAGCGNEAERTASAPAGKPAAHGEQTTMAPLPKARPKLVQPEAGKTTSSAVDALPDNAKLATNDDTSLPKPTGPATITEGSANADPNAKGLSATKATALSNGVALPPLQAPDAVLDVIRAGNIIARTPYKWGGGHGRFKDNGYDCSGSVSYALYYAGLIDGPHVAAELMAYGKPGPGKWISIYANGGHVYMEVAGIRFDTSAASSANHFSRWQNALRDNRGFEVRHPPGL
ncbi:MAG: peptidoglycan DL-endopeptidase RipB [Solirubrobacteraceae bacterium]|jgi:cell wall-associated NlpC family hydrolase|nr:peptidoglycan DL-endopeptidase RipB [Solirubrobacteraceae bacterium]